MSGSFNRSLCTYHCINNDFVRIYMYMQTVYRCACPCTTFVPQYIQIFYCSMFWCSTVIYVQILYCIMPKLNTAIFIELVQLSICAQTLCYSTHWLCIAECADFVQKHAQNVLQYVQALYCSTTRIMYRLCTLLYLQTVVL